MDLCLFILMNKRHQISYRIYYVLVRGQLCVQKVVIVLNKTSHVRYPVPVKEMSLATTPIHTHTFTDDSDEEVDTYNFCY